jgi:hypothetical protein
LVVIDHAHAGKYLSASELRELSEQVGLPVPNTRTETPDDQVARIIGKHLGLCFKDGDHLQLDSIKVRRHVIPAARPKGQKGYDIKTLCLLVGRRTAAAARVEGRGGRGGRG